MAQRRQRNRELLYEYLLSHPCVDCGERDPIVLDFDHLRDKKYRVANIVATGCSWERIVLEIEKCAVRCANCHRRKTAKDLNYFKYRKSTTQSNLGL